MRYLKPYCYYFNLGGNTRRNFPDYPIEYGPRCQLKDIFLDKKDKKKSCYDCHPYSAKGVQLKDIRRGIEI